MTVKTALNAQKDMIENLSQKVQKMEQDAADLRAAMLNLLLETGTVPATPGKDSIVC